MCEIIGILLLSGFGGQINFVIPEWQFFVLCVYVMSGYA
jgi:hypothetical protein